MGAGAAGLMAAIHAAEPRTRVLLIERTADGGRKILISGGGRCNVLPGTLDERRFITASSANTLRKILRSWPLAEQRDFFERTLGLPLVLEPETGKLFPAANRSRAVRDALRSHAQSLGVEFVTETEIVDVAKTDVRWTLRSRDGRVIVADAVIITTGGLSVPATGSDGFGLRLLGQLGHEIAPTYPALTPLTLDPPRFESLAGVSLDVELTATDGDVRRSARGGFLFTHRGYSGPSVLDLSDVAVRTRLETRAPAQLRVRWGAIPDETWNAALTPSAQSVLAAVRALLPARLAAALIEIADVDGATSLAQLKRDARLRLLEQLTRFPLPWSGDEGYKKAEVTGGGASLAGFNAATLESRSHPGLFAAGEVLDAFGPIGGYNFVWAWTTGRLAGIGARRYGAGS